MFCLCRSVCLYHLNVYNSLRAIHQVAVVCTLTDSPPHNLHLLAVQGILATATNCIYTSFSAFECVTMVNNSEYLCENSIHSIFTMQSAFCMYWISQGEGCKKNAEQLGSSKKTHKTQVIVNIWIYIIKPAI